jgi:hypothetical protein
MHRRDRLLIELNWHRGRMIDPKFWPGRVREFEREWSPYKRAAA